ncbi:MAG: carbamoyltransferase HypF [Nitrospinae bacterium RIFCSPLOWO2_02_FULL_39_110]|nr:MAG: carbamoyltransferase HypF [Nitrospinae bacterium RIFCSPHIGHO2_12_FULL_39_42]OGW01911.1 MAG: carbamoyltransferase HypF [Nitrospinae bacterium RIFCSPLOWO2_02_39_17]OGW07280.1 MAG: carbamoyltransferase HypF [Nitrospinae bacterium RIFCSPLOWO2_02_FULL_39_110]OGW12559.1 MAG: carbamoyltransferase HypF [Nitrospinae bacterium RIFCSPLOWO2_12_FULL_39_93]
MSTTRKEIKISGIVQGVGFRPFVYNLATSLGLKGYVLNSSEGVIIDVEGETQKIDEFIYFLKSKAPSLSKIENITVAAGFSLHNYTSFEIRESFPDGKPVPECFNRGFALISPDIATCHDCLSELLNPDDRRYQYPFINCTNCGPRYSIILDIPYDRPKTTMSKFKMCPDCEKEYHDPSNRRFHAQPNACPKCGPQIQLQVTSYKLQVNEKDPLDTAIELLKQGAIGAIKGLGGFHLACDAANDDAVKRLREKKRKSNKPFAIMCPDIDTVKRICKVSAQSEKILGGKLKPIVLLPKKSEAKASHYMNPISKYVASDNNYFGVLLPYTPLHQLLLNPPSPPFKKGGTGGILVMTSGNLSEEPIVINNYEAIERLSDIADFFLFHNRDIYMRVDDSIVREYTPPLSPPSKGGERGVVIRRARGYVPYPVELDIDMPEILGCGGKLKNTFTLTKGHYAIMSQHIGDLENYEAIEFYKETLKNLKNSFRVEPTIIAHDMHPNYWTTKFAKELITHHSSLITVPVQHHHAHIVSCMVENHIRDKVIGIAWDGTGYGTDGAIWGGEFLIADYKGFERAGYFRYTPLPGGDKAIKEPYRIALSHLYDTYGMDFLKLDISFIKGGQGVVPLTKDKKIKTILKMIDNRINTVMTSSAGRLFDAVSSIINGINAVTFEGEAAIKLEMMADKSVKDVYESQGSGVRSQESEYPLIIDARILIHQIVTDLLNGVGHSVISAKFHNTLAEIIYKMCQKIKADTGIDRVVLSGGCFQNILLLDRTLNKLNTEFKTFIHKNIPTNDGGISLGQAVIAAEKGKNMEL